MSQSKHRALTETVEIPLAQKGILDTLRIVLRTEARSSLVARRSSLVARRSTLATGCRWFRLLGDTVPGVGPWGKADMLSWDLAYRAEYVALAEMQADAFAILDTELGRCVEGIGVTALIDVLRC
jgi:hypothetical protein